MQTFSLIERSMERYTREVAERAAMQPADPWPAAERTQAKRRERVARARADFWEFDRIYFPPELYRQGYAPPAEMHREIVRAFSVPGVHWFLGFRNGGKTVTGKKRFGHGFLADEWRVGGTLSSTLIPSRNILADIERIVAENPRITEDFGIDVVESNGDAFRFYVRVPGEKPYLCTIAPFSEERSVRGYSEMFNRPEVILSDDLENRQSSLERDQVRWRESILQETKSSLSLDGKGVIVGFGNNFDEQSMANQLVLKQQKRRLHPKWKVYVFPAWDPETGSAWPERFPATSEKEMQEMLELTDEEWPGDGQQQPKQPNGDIFPLEFWTEYTVMPADVIGVIVTDQNLALKGMGDTTGLANWFYSPSTNAFYMGSGYCQSYRDPNMLLDDALSLWTDRTFLIEFDGWVNQESSWENHIRNYSQIRNRPFPRVEFARVNVDLKAANVMAYWYQGRVKFPAGWAETEQGKRAKNQIVSFRGKKANRKDDFPDCMIRGIESLLRMGLAPEETRPENSPATRDFYSFDDPFRF